MIYCDEHSHIVRANLKDTGSTSKITSRESNIKDMTLFGDGDCLLKSDIYLKNFTASVSDLNALNIEPSIYTITLLDFDVAIKHQTNIISMRKMSEEMNQIQHMNQVKKVSLELYQQLKSSNGKYSLLESKEDITSYNLICNKGLTAPYVFENQGVISFDDFYTSFPIDCLWHGELRVGTQDGNCYKVAFHFDENGQLTKNTQLVFSNGQLREKELRKDKFVRMFSIDKRTEITIDSFMTETEDGEYFVHDYRKFLLEDIEIVIMGQRTQKKPDFRREFIISACNENSKWVKTKFTLENLDSYIGGGCFRLHKMNNSLNQCFYKFYFVGNVGIGALCWNTLNTSLHLDYFLEKSIKHPDRVIYSHGMDLFYIPIDNSVEIWNSDLTIFIHKLQVETEILSIYLSDESKDQRLLIYEELTYQEIDMVSLQFLRLQKLEKNKKGLIVPLHLDMIKSNESIHLPTFNQEIACLNFISDSEDFYMFDFPFINLPSCFSKHNYKQNIMLYAHYYFRNMVKFNYVDRIYGPLNPITLAIYHNDISLLEELLDKYQYPKETIGYLSPLSFAFVNEYSSAVQILCEHLLYRDYNVDFSRLDFQFLLNSNQIHCHDLLVTIPRKMNQNNSPSFVYMTNKVKLFQASNIMENLTTIKTNQFHKETHMNSKQGGGCCKRKVDKKIKNEVNSFKIPFKYSYNAGTTDSLKFLHRMAFTKSDNFVLCEWKEIVHQKWRDCYPYLLLKGFIFLVMTLMIVVPAFCKNVQNYLQILQITSFIFVGVWFILLVWALLEFIAYCSFTLKGYENF